MSGRVLLIGGAPRAGKTTLAVRLAREAGYSRISLDSISEALNRGFPEIVISDWTDQAESAEKKFAFFETFVETLVNDAKRYGLRYVMDQYDFTPEYIEKLPFRADLDVCYLGFPEIPTDEIRRVIREYADPEDWIAQVDDDYLTVVAERIRRVNQMLRQQCGALGYRFIDTGVGEDRIASLNALFEEFAAL